MNRNYQYTVLAVDDEIFNLEAIQRTLRNRYQVLTTTSPREALKIFTDEKVHLVIADQRMPEMPGTELLGKMKEISPHPIRMVLSAYTDIDYLIDAINRGEVYRYITKPWDPGDLRMTVEKALEHYQAMMDRLRLLEELEEKNAELQIRNTELSQALRELRDTQDKLLEAERFSVLGRMAGMIIHDLKQPLDFIRSATETMANLDLDQTERLDFAQMIREETNRFVEMIQEILDYSRGDFRLKRETFSLTDLWNLIETRIRSYLKNYEIGLRILPLENEAEVKVDIHRIQRAFLNLIKNAIEAFRETAAPPSPLITITNTVEDGHWVATLQDNGPGIPEEVLDRIFDPFVSARRAHGIGLGLAIVKHIIEEHGGNVSCESEKNRGTTFILRLPVQSA